jgi:hypothetical protein
LSAAALERTHRSLCLAESHGRPDSHDLLRLSDRGQDEICPLPLLLLRSRYHRMLDVWPPFFVHQHHSRSVPWVCVASPQSSEFSSPDHDQRVGGAKSPHTHTHTLQRVRTFPQYETTQRNGHQAAVRLRSPLLSDYDQVVEQHHQTCCSNARGQIGPPARHKVQSSECVPGEALLMCSSL